MKTKTEVKSKTEVKVKWQALVAWFIMRGYCVCRMGDTIVLFDPESPEDNYHFVGSDGGLRVDRTKITGERLKYLQEVLQLME